MATTGLVVLTTGFSDDAMLFSRLVDTGIGVAVGLLVNVLVWPPLRSRTTIAAIDRLDDAIGELLVDMSQTLRDGTVSLETVTEWIDRTRDIDESIEHAWALVRQAQESSRMNPRRRARDVRDPQGWRDLLRRMEQAVAEVRSLARTWGAETTAARRRTQRFSSRGAGCSARRAGPCATPIPMLCTTYVGASTSSSRPSVPGPVVRRAGRCTGL